MEISNLPKIHESQNKDLAHLIRLPHGTSSIVMTVSMRWALEFKINHALGFQL
jgi:hypothetical protein